MVLEGVHLVPGLLPPIGNALAVQCVLTIEHEERHASHFWVRDLTSDGMRPMQRYLDVLGAWVYKRYRLYEQPVRSAG